MKLHFRPRAQRGFTLLELLVVLVVLGLLAGIVAPKYFAQLGRSEVKVAKAQIEGHRQLTVKLLGLQLPEAFGLFRSNRPDDGA